MPIEFSNSQYPEINAAMVARPLKCLGEEKLITVVDQLLGRNQINGMDCALVIESQEIVKILQPLDVLALICALVPLGEITAGEVTKIPPVVKQAQELKNIWAVVQLFHRHNLQLLPVLWPDKPEVSLITANSLVYSLGDWRGWQWVRVKDVLSPEPLWVDPHASLLTVAAKLVAAQVNFSFVCESSKDVSASPLGKITVWSILRHWLQEKTLAGAVVADHFQPLCPQVGPEDSLTKVQELIAVGQVFPIAVVGGKGELLGWLGEQELLKSLHFAPLLTRLRSQILDLEAENRQLVNAQLVQQDFSQLIASITSAFVNISGANLAGEIQNSLEQLGRVTNVDKCAFFSLDPSTNTFSMELEWCHPSIPVQINQVQQVPYQQFPWLISLASRGQVCYLNDISQAPPEAVIDAQSWLSYGLKSVLLIPLIQAKQTTGLIGVASFQRCKVWSEGEVRLLKILGQTIADAQERLAAEEKIQILQRNLAREQRRQFLARVRRENEERFRQTEHLLQRQLWAIEAAIEGIALLEAEKFIYINKAHLQLFGYQQPEDLLGKSWQVLYSPTEVERLLEEVMPILGQEGYWQGEAIATRQDGSIFNEGVSLTRTADGVIICVCRDITPQKTAEKLIKQQANKEVLLRQINERIRESLDLSIIFKTACDQIRQFMAVERVAIFQFDLDSGYDDGGFVAESIGPGIGSVLSKRVQDHCFGEGYSRLYQQGQFQAIEDILDSHLQECHVDILRQFQVRSNLVIPLLRGKELWGLLCIHNCTIPRIWPLEEITFIQQIAAQLAIAIEQADLFEILKQQNESLNLANQKLAQVTQLKDNFLAGMSHELRTPLNAILGSSEVLLEEILGKLSPSQFRAIELIEKSGRHLLDLITDILDLSKIEAGKLEIYKTKTSVTKICEDSLILVAPMASRKEIEIQSLIPPYLPPIYADELRIRQVLINLLSNAIKFTPAQGHITLQVELTDDEQKLLFSVTDTGIGIAPEDQNTIFEPFVQIDSRLSRQYSGTGLGLSLVQRLVTLHGGKISLNSSLGQGSCFTVWLPYEPASEPLEPTAVAPKTSDNIAVPALVILLVDDNEANLQTFSDYLSLKGYTLLLARNGQEALDLAQMHHPDLILMDIQMPIMDGLEATARIRANPAIASIPIIALTALALPGDEQRCLQAGADAYLTKPVRFRLLIETIQKFRPQSK